MNSLMLDPRFTFDTFIVGPPTRLAVAAARRVAEAPGSAYNPLFIYSASGLGKTHLTMAVGHHAGRVRTGLVVVYETLEHLLEEITAALQAGEQDAFRHRLRDADVLLVDDVQFLTGRRAAQDELLRAWDALSLRGGQVVLASDRPPTEIDDLDDRLLSRFSGGLIVDLAAPDYETRIAIVKRKAGERGHTLSPGVAEALARVPFGNVRELQGGLNRVLALQELDGRDVGAEEVGRLFGERAAPAQPADEFGSFLAEVSGAVAAAIASPARGSRLADAITEWQRKGYRTGRLDVAAASGDAEPDRVEALLAGFAVDAERLDSVAGEIRALDGNAPELARSELLRDPDRLAEAQQLLDEVRERLKPLPAPPAGASFATLGMDESLFAVRAARAIASQPGGAYNPFLVHGPAGTGKSELLAAIGTAALATAGAGAVAFLTAETLSAELVGAIERNRVDGWRARIRRARVLIIDDLDALAHTERAQEELFHLFDDLRRSGAQLVFSATRAPHEIAGLEERLRTRLESGLVVELVERAGNAAEVAAGRNGTLEEAWLPPETAASVTAAVLDTATAAPHAAGRQAPEAAIDEWFLSTGRIVLEWPDPSAWLIEELG